MDIPTTPLQAAQIVAANRQQQRSRAKNPGAEPEQHMSPFLRWSAIIVAAMLDAARFACYILAFSAPFLIASGTKTVAISYLDNIFGSTVGGWLGNFAGVLAGGLTSTLPILMLIVGTAVILSCIIGFIGATLFNLGFLAKGAFRYNTTYYASWLIFNGSVTPFINMLPWCTPSVWFVVGTMQREDDKKYAKWKEANDATVQQQQQDRAERVAGVQAAWMIAQEAATEEENAIEEEDAETESESLDPPEQSSSEKSPRLAPLPAY